MKQLLLDLANKYEEEYKQWCKDNPGYVMNIKAIKADVCKKLAETCNTIEDIELKRNWYLTKYSEFRDKNLVNGFYVSWQLCNEILKLIEENEKT